MTSSATIDHSTRAPHAAGRRDGAEKVSGAAQYTGDLQLPGMLHARLLLAGRVHARLLRLDATQARLMPGVRAVLTAADVPLVRFGMAVRDRTLFATEVVRFEGEIVAAVAATTLDAAGAAIDQIAADYEDLEPVLDPRAALEPGSPLVHPEAASYASGRPDTRSGNDCARVTILKGDADAALAASATIVEQSFSTEMSHPAAIEPHAVVADWTGDHVTIWSTTQVPFLARAGVALALGIPEASVRVVVTHLGGGFGGKCDFHLEAHAAALSRAAGRPVRLVLTRREEFLVPDMTRHPIDVTLTTGLDSSGRITARRARLVLDTGAYATHGPTASELATLMAVGPYRIEHLDIEARTVYTTRTPAGSTRAPTGPQMCWAVEQHTDELAARAGLDPVAFRQLNVVRGGDTTPTGQLLVEPTGGDCITRAAELAAEPIGESVAPLPALGDWVEATGFAAGWWGNVPLPSGAAVRLHADGTATLISGAQDNGSGAAVSLVLLVADELGLQARQIGLVHQDTAATPFDYGSLGSQTTFNAGRAALAAARIVRGQVAELAGHHLGVSPDELVFAGGRIHDRERPEHGVALAAIALAAQDAGTPLMAQAGPLPPERPVELHAARNLGRTMYSSFPFPAFYCCAARVAVDRETGRVIVREVIACHDAGTILNPLGAEGQVEGGVAHSIGMALNEGMTIDGGRQQGTSFMDYRLLTAADAPRVKVAWVSRTAGDGPRGTRGIGEAAVIAGAGAVANGIAAATGARVHQLPMHPHRVWAALEAGAVA
jgi:CO/xanthine dehydrogenase Mo-binding subunit